MARLGLCSHERHGGRLRPQPARESRAGAFGDSEFLLDSPDLVAFIAKRVEATTDLSNRVKKSRLQKLDAEISKLEAEQLRHAKAAALAEVERQFGGVAA